MPRISQGLALVVLVSTAGSMGRAEELRAKDASTVRVVVNRAPRLALSLRPQPSGGWRVTLLGRVASGAAQLIDLTPGTPARTLSATVLGGELTLDTPRFVAGHVYQLQLRGEGGPGSSALVYLVPPRTEKAPRRAGPTRVRFDEGPTAPPPPQDNAIQAVEKPKL
jgi:hypothetical protein